MKSTEAFRSHRFKKHGVLPPRKTLDDLPTCELCGEKFTGANQLRQHKTVHEDNRLHRCPLCDHGANLYRCLVAHLHNIHHVTVKRKFSFEVDYTKDPGTFNENIKPRSYILYDAVDGTEIGRNCFDEPGVSAHPSSSENR
jgi:hypothetical protein